MKHRAIFLDRDGTVIKDKGYLKGPAGVELLPGAGEALGELKQTGFLLVVVTNQSGIGRGFFPFENVTAQHDKLQAILHPFGAGIDRFEICPHAPEEDCECRKPAPQMLLRAAAGLGIDLNRSLMIGDKASDIMAGKAAGCRTILLSDGHETDTEPADFIFPNLAAAADFIISEFNLDHH